MKRDYTEQELKDFEIDELKKQEIAKLIEDGGTVKVTQTFNLDKKATVKADFVLAFTSNLRQLAELNISQNELKIITYILEIMEFGNLISINQSVIAKELGLAKSNVSYTFKKLRNKNILIEKNGHLFMNSSLFQKGLSHSLTTERRENLKNAQVTQIGENKQLNLLPTI
jgi:DNA-binding MarR family transcriptional regulator